MIKRALLELRMLDEYGRVLSPTTGKPIALLERQEELDEVAGLHEEARIEDLRRLEQDHSLLQRGLGHGEALRDPGLPTRKDARSESSGRKESREGMAIHGDLQVGRAPSSEHSFEPLGRAAPGRVGSTARSLPVGFSANALGSETVCSLGTAGAVAMGGRAATALRALRWFACREAAARLWRTPTAPRCRRKPMVLI